MRNACSLFCVLIWLGGGQALAAAAGEDCATLEDPAARLACYDAKFPRPESPTPAAPVTEPVVEPSADKEPSAEPTPAPPTAPAEPQPAAPPAEKGLFGDQKVDLTSTITALLAGEKQKMVFQLANDQIWIQATPRPLPFKVGDTVTIRNATLGGYFMRSEKGTSTRVQRIH